jgi:hypothetical protein
VSLNNTIVELHQQDIYTWDELFKIHGTRNAVNYDNEMISSVLSGSEHHNDELDHEKVIYKIPNRAYYKKTIERFDNQLKNKNSFKLFHKLKTNCWKYMGLFNVLEINNTEKFYVIVFIKS